MATNGQSTTPPIEEAWAAAILALGSYEAAMACFLAAYHRRAMGGPQPQDRRA